MFSIGEITLIIEKKSEFRYSDFLTYELDCVHMISFSALFKLDNSFESYYANIYIYIFTYIPNIENVPITLLTSEWFKIKTPNYSITYKLKATTLCTGKNFSS